MNPKRWGKQLTAWKQTWDGREVFARMWRWPLRSRARDVLTLLVIVLAVFSGPRLTSHPQPAAATDPASLDAAESAASESLINIAVSGQPSASNASAALSALQPTASAPASPASPITTTPTSGSAAATTTAPNASTTPAAAIPIKALTKAPSPPSLTVTPADFTSAAAVAARYLQVWCYQPAAQAANTNIANVASWVTAAGWADDKTRAVTNDSWARTQKAGLTSVCGPVQASTSAEAPNSYGLQWMQLSARQAFVNKAGVIVGQQTINQIRRVLRAPDGRWLVDMEVQAG